MMLLSNLRKFWHLSWSDQMLFSASLALLPVTALGVRFLGLKRWHTLLGHAIPLYRKSHRVQADATATASNIAHLVKAAATHGLFHGNCLQQSLVLWSLLRRHGIEADLRIGMQKQADEVKGHAWVEFGGAVLNDSPDVNVQFVPAESNYFNQ